jgi:hypothetical protein
MQYVPCATSAPLALPSPTTQTFLPKKDVQSKYSLVCKVWPVKELKPGISDSPGTEGFDN